MLFYIVQYNAMQCNTMQHRDGSGWHSGGPGAVGGHACDAIRGHRTACILLFFYLFPFWIYVTCNQDFHRQRNCLSIWNIIVIDRIVTLTMTKGGRYQCHRKFCCSKRATTISIGAASQMRATKVSWSHHFPCLQRLDIDWWNFKVSAFLGLRGKLTVKKLNQKNKGRFRLKIVQS